ncbi:MAG: AAA family ATPase [Candidatus Binatia bacterium]
MSHDVCPRCGRAQSEEGLACCAACGAPLRRACGSCGHRGEPGARFCSACGASLAADAAPTAPSPTGIGPRAYTPRHLAERILGQRAAIEGERKQVTVLFLDMKGSMEIASEVDPEEWHALMDRFFVIASAAVHRWEGTVNQYAGDGIMALFGAPLALEDHAERACHAALDLAAEFARTADDLKRERGFGFAVRIGLNSGEVVVGSIGDDLRMDYTAQGHTVGLAARMEQLAHPGHVYLTEATAALVGGRFALRDLGPHNVRGVREPVRVFELAGRGTVRTRLEESRARGFSRLVGRADEAARLEAALSRAIEGRGGVVAVSGDAGVGKSRLCFELAAAARGRGVVVHEAHAVPYGRSVPFLPALELLRGLLGVGERDAPEAARRKVAGTLLLLDRSLDDALPLVFEFLGIPDGEAARPRTDPDARRRRLIEIARRLLRDAATRAPLLLVVEDLHWIDAASEAFLRGLAQDVDASRVLLLLDFRPEYEASWLAEAGAEFVALEPLGPDASAELLHALLGDDPSLGDLPARIAEQTAGNPFFIEEVVRALADAGRLAGVRGGYRLAVPDSAIVLPATVQAVLAARIDALPESGKALLQTAAVIGRTFAREVLQRVAGADDASVDRAIDALVRAEFLEPAGDEGRAGAAYAFAHPLTHEVAYRTQLAARREQLHAAVARALEQIWQGRTHEIAALLAHHHEHGGDRLAAARWSRVAAERAMRSDVAEAVRLWTRARDLVAGLPDDAETISIGIWAHIQLLNLGWRAGLDDAEARRMFESALEIAKRAADASATSGVLVTYGALRGLAGDSRTALELVAEAARLARETTDLGAQVATQAALVQTQIMSGRLRDARVELHAALATVTEHPGVGSEQTGFDTLTWFLAMRGQLLTETGDLAGAERDLDLALERARKLDEIETLGWTHEMRSYLARWHADAAGARTHAEEAVRISERTGSAFSQTSAYGTLALAHRLVGEWQDARRNFAHVLDIIGARGSFRHWEAVTLAYLGETEVMLGAHDDGLARVRRGLDLAVSRGAHFIELICTVALVRALLATRADDAVREASRLLLRADELATRTGAGSWVPLVAMERARIARLAGDDDAAANFTARAREAFAAIGAHVLARGAGEHVLPYV